MKSTPKTIKYRRAHGNAISMWGNLVLYVVSISLLNSGFGKNKVIYKTGKEE